MVPFARLAENQGAAPLVVYLPARVGFLHPDHRMLNQIVTTLRARGIHYVDLTSCLGALDVSELFIAGRPHHSPKGNARAARRRFASAPTPLAHSSSAISFLTISSAGTIDSTSGRSGMTAAPATWTIVSRPKGTGFISPTTV
jgi:hypothetical protein